MALIFLTLSNIAFFLVLILLNAKENSYDIEI